MNNHPFGRRTLLTGSAAAAAAAMLAKLTPAQAAELLRRTTPPGGTGPVATPATGAPTPNVGGSLKILNWQLYIDVTEGETKGTVDRFQEVSGVKVDYLEDFNDNDEVFNRELMPVVGNGKASSFDIMCPTYWMAARLKTLEWLEKLPLDKIPNHANLEDGYKSLDWDQGAEYHMPWQGGLTGIAYNPALTGRDLTTVNDLFDPALKGKVGMLTEMRDSLGLTMLAMGLDVTKPDKDAMHKGLDKIEEAAKSGQIRQFTGNEYVQSLETGDFAACVAWSGDVVQLQNSRPDIKFVFPEQGAMSWFDTMVIPKGSANIDQAAAWMNFVYDPSNAAQLTKFVQYISPVKGVKEALLAEGGDSATLAENPILFPDEETRKRLFVFASLDEDTEAEIAERFLKISGG